MFRVRGELAESMGSVVTATLPDRMVKGLQSRGLQAEKEASSGAVVMTDARGEKTRLTFLETGLPASVVFPSGRNIDFSHDEQGALSALTYPTGEQIHLQHDDRGRLTALSYDDACAYRLDHDEDGRLRQVTYPDASTTTFVYGAQGLDRLIDRTGAVTTYARNEREGRHTITDPMGRVTTLETGARGKLTRLVFPDGSTQEHELDADGNVLGVVRRDGTTVRYEHDEGGTLRALLWPDGTRTSIWKDPKAGTFGLENALDRVRIERDDREQPVREETSAGAVGYEYDEDGRLTSIRTPFGDTVSYVYDCDGRLERVIGWDGQAARFEHSEIGAVRAIHMGSSVVERREQGRLGLFTGATVLDAEGQILSQQHYAYDACDRLLERQDVWGPGDDDIDHRRFVYDPEGRILAELQPSTERILHEYEYDTKGNLTYDGGARFVFGAMDDPLYQDEREIAYDRLGNMVTIPARDDRDLRCAWAADGTLREVWLDDVHVRFGYDPLGRRISKQVGRSTWRYGWAAGLLLWEEWQPHAGATPIRRDYMYLPDGKPLAFREDGKTFWLQTDPRGAVIRAFDDAGNIVWRARYDSFGRAHVEVELVRQPLRLAGQYEDEETGLHYNLARYYCPWLKSYLSLDPQWLSFGASNYSYVRNEPWNRVDPEGALGPLAIVGAIALGAVVGAAVNAAIAYFTSHDNLWAAAANGAITGAFTVVGTLVGALAGPVGAVVGGIVGGAVGTFFGTLVEGAMNGRGWCWECAARAAVTSIIIDLLTLGLSKIPGVRALLQKAGKYVDELLRPVRRHLDELARRAGQYVDDALRRARKYFDDVLGPGPRDPGAPPARPHGDAPAPRPDDDVPGPRPDDDAPPPRPDDDAPPPGTGAPASVHSATAEQIAGGHAYDKHVVERGEFPEVTSRQDFQTVIQDTMDNSTHQRTLSGGRKAYYDEGTNTIVIHNPSAPDGGTAFRPVDGIDYFRGLR